MSRIERRMTLRYTTGIGRDGRNAGQGVVRVPAGCFRTHARTHTTHTQQALLRQTRPNKISSISAAFLFHFSSFHNTPSPLSSSYTMPVAPITGTLRKQFFVTLTTSFGLATASGYAYWYVLRTLNPLIISFSSDFYFYF